MSLLSWSLFLETSDVCRCQSLQRSVIVAQDDLSYHSGEELLGGKKVFSNVYLNGKGTQMGGGDMGPSARWKEYVIYLIILWSLYWDQSFSHRRSTLTTSLVSHVHSCSFGPMSIYSIQSETALLGEFECTPPRVPSSLVKGLDSYHLMQRMELRSSLQSLAKFFSHWSIGCQVSPSFLWQCFVRKGWH